MSGTGPPLLDPADLENDRQPERGGDSHSDAGLLQFEKSLKNQNIDAALDERFHLLPEGGLNCAGGPDLCFLEKLHRPDRTGDEKIIAGDFTGN